MVGLAIGEQFENGVGLGGIDGLAHLIVRVGETDIALTTVVTILLAKVAQQLSATADMIVGRIGNHRLDALAKLFLARFIDYWRQLYMRRVLPSLQIAYVGRLLLRDEVQDMLCAQVFQNHMGCSFQACRARYG